MSKSLISFSFGERCEWIAQVAHQNRAMWANCSGRSQKMSDHDQFAQGAQRKWGIVSESRRLLTKNERMSESLNFRKKTIDSFGNPMSEFPDLLNIFAKSNVKLLQYTF